MNDHLFLLDLTPTQFSLVLCTPMAHKVKTGDPVEHKPQACHKFFFNCFYNILQGKLKITILLIPFQISNNKIVTVRFWVSFFADIE